VVYKNEYLYSDDGRPPWDPDDLDQWTPPYLDAWVASAALGQVTTRRDVALRRRVHQPLMDAARGCYTACRYANTSMM